MHYRILTLWLILVLIPSIVDARRPSDQATMIILPDTQKLVATAAPAVRREMLNAQTAWIAAQRDTQGIAFVSHAGDITDSGGAEQGEWQDADTALDTLDGVVPYSVVGGNHDLEVPGSVKSGWKTYLTWFGPQRFAKYAWFGGASDDGLSTYQRFQMGDYTFLHLALELEVPDDAIRWAQGVIDAHPDMPTIITTHAYLRDTGRRTTASEVQFSGNSGDAIWQQLVKPNDQIVLVLNGHFWQEDGVGQLVSQNSAGHPVIQLSANYQAYTDGGSGYLRLLTFDMAAQKLLVKTFSPYLNRFKTDAANEFTLPLDLRRFAPTRPPATTTATRQPAPTATATRTPVPTLTATRPPTPTATRVPTTTRTVPPSATATPMPTVTRTVPPSATATVLPTPLPSATSPPVTPTMPPTVSGPMPNQPAPPAPGDVLLPLILN